MPLILEHKNNDDHVALWQIGPGEFKDISEMEFSADPFKGIHQNRLKQRMACLKMVSIYAGNDSEIFYDKHGKPHIKNDPRQLSFSHSGDFAAIMVSKKFAGIDFELIRPKILNIIHKFLNRGELANIQSQSQVEHAHVYWGAKEALYKIYGKQQLIFKENILIDPFDFNAPRGFFSGRIQTSDYKKDFKLYYEMMFGYMLVYVVN